MFDPTSKSLIENTFNRCNRRRFGTLPLSSNAGNAVGNNSNSTRAKRVPVSAHLIVSPFIHRYLQQNDMTKFSKSNFKSKPTCRGKI